MTRSKLELSYLNLAIEYIYKYEVLCLDDSYNSL